MSRNKIVHTMGNTMAGGDSGGCVKLLYTSILPLVKNPDSAPTPKLRTRLMINGFHFIVCMKTDSPSIVFAILCRKAHFYELTALW